MEFAEDGVAQLLVGEELVEAVDGPVAFDDGFLGLKNGLGGEAFGDLLSEGAVAAPGAEAGGNEVAESAESVEGFCLAAEGGADFYEFVEGAGEVGSFGVVAKF